MTETLKDLIELAAKKRDTRSGRALADLTVGREHRIDRTQLNQIRKGTYNSKPSPALIEAVAWLAGVSKERAYRAAGRPLPSSTFVSQLPPGVEELTPPQRHAVITVIRAFLGSAEQEGGGEHGDGSAPTGDAPPGPQNPLYVIGDVAARGDAPPGDESRED